ncbi:hypothetical protein Ddye_012783 [Dipteronia dyeriana]|uniref:Uncharacterized protein n=1 Tax=Dipteronia dyeriana TaxID=168575 RepID=A0AAD9X582_9ROSI|nr:hypothetical protein Ddye_012783 [Dipteronia dyeriana]
MVLTSFWPDNSTWLLMFLTRKASELNEVVKDIIFSPVCGLMFSVFACCCSLLSLLPLCSSYKFNLYISLFQPYLLKTESNVVYICFFFFFANTEPGSSHILIIARGGTNPLPQAKNRSAIFLIF